MGYGVEEVDFGLDWKRRTKIDCLGVLEVKDRNGSQEHIDETAIRVANIMGNGLYCKV